MVSSHEQFKMKVISSLVKVFPEREPLTEPECTRFTSLQGEVFSFQLAYYGDIDRKEFVSLAVKSQLEQCIQYRLVELVPSTYPCHSTIDDNYLKSASGMYPDRLSVLTEPLIPVIPHQWHSIWIDIHIKKTTSAGTYPIQFALLSEGNAVLCEINTSLQIYKGQLPIQTILHTEWFHADCLADYYHSEPWSEEYWRILESFLSVYGKHSMNMILTPIFTPPLDTQIGGERTTIQLVDIHIVNKQYEFDFDKLERFVDLCLSLGITYFEMSHLFTQWGAAYAPKIIAVSEGKTKKLFGWETDALSTEYQEFLGVFLPQLTAFWKERKLQNNVYFHISDEPSVHNLDSYKRASDSICPYLEGFPIIDALSNYEFYQMGTVSIPVVANDHIQPFIDNHVEDLWTYYCTSQCLQVSNRFMAMPSSRNRILGVQLYKYRIKGFLHWGFNFYNTQYSLEHINPYVNTDAGGSFPSGDPFLVYPGADGIPEESIRLLVLDQAFSDYRALELLESLTSRDYVLKIIDKELSVPITFSDYPKSDMYILSLRNKINEEIGQRVQVL